MEAKAFLAPGLDLGALQRFPLDFLMTFLVQNENGLARSTCSMMRMLRICDPLGVCSFSSSAVQLHIQNIQNSETDTLFL